MNIDLLSIAGHKIYAPKEIGALYVKKGLLPEKFCHGAGQEMGWRAGTENVLEIVGLGKACEMADHSLDHTGRHLAAMRDRLHNGLAAQLDSMRLNGHPYERLPNTLSLSFKGLEANRIFGRDRSGGGGFRWSRLSFRHGDPLPRSGGHAHPPWNGPKGRCAFPPAA